MKLTYPKNTTSSEDMCKILDYLGIKVEEYTDCTMTYLVTFEQLRTIYNMGKENRLTEL